MIKKILSQPELQQYPPVLIDIGASGNMHTKWRKIAKYCIAVFFDADKREMQYAANNTKRFKKAFVIDKIVFDLPSQQKRPFFLTKSPFCSSTLEPENDQLNVWDFAELFQIEKVVKINTITIQEMLQSAGLTYIDWIKLDTQGTDLRIFLSINAAIRRRIAVVEMEPGLIDVYKGEDQMQKVMKQMRKEGFWLSYMNLLGPKRLKGGWIQENIKGPYRKVAHTTLPISPGWGEMLYLNEIKDHAIFEKRHFLILFLFSFLERQYGFCIEVLEKAFLKFKDEIFKELYTDIIKQISRESYIQMLKYPLHFPVSVYKKILSKFLFSF